MIADMFEPEKDYSKTRQELLLEARAKVEAMIMFTKVAVIAIPLYIGLIKGLIKGMEYLDCKTAQSKYSDFAMKSEELNLPSEYTKNLLNIVDYYNPKSEKYCSQAAFTKRSAEKCAELDSLENLIYSSHYFEKVDSTMRQEYHKREMHQLTNSDPIIQMCNFAEYLSKKLKKKN